MILLWIENFVIMQTSMHQCECGELAQLHCLGCKLTSCFNCSGSTSCFNITHDWRVLTPDTVVTSSVVPAPAPSAMQPPPNFQTSAPPPIVTNLSETNETNKRVREQTPTNSGTSTSTNAKKSSANPQDKKKAKESLKEVDPAQVEAIPFTMGIGGNNLVLPEPFDPNDDGDGEHEVMFNLGMLLSLYAPSIVAIFGLVIVFSIVTKADGQVAARSGACLKTGNSEIEVDKGTVEEMIIKSKSCTDGHSCRHTMHNFTDAGGFTEMLAVFKDNPQAVKLIQNNSANNPSNGDNITLKTWILIHCKILRQFMEDKKIRFLEEKLDMAGCPICLVFLCDPSALLHPHEKIPLYCPLIFQQGTKWTWQAGLDLCGRTLLSASFILGLNVMLLLIDLERPKLPQRKQNALLREKYFLDTEQNLTDMERYAAALAKKDDEIKEKDAINALLRSELEAARSSLEQVKLTMVENKGTMDAILVAVGGMAVDE